MPQDAKDIQLTERKDMIAQLNNTIAALTEMIRQKDEANARLAEEVSYLRKKLFGASSEKRQGIDPNQLTLFDMEGGLEIPVADAEEISETVVKGHTRQRKKKPALEEQFPGATVNRVVVDSLTDEEKKCPVCGTEMVPIGTEVIR
ncbi:MAG: IS66 family transposase, partial [Eubacteriales bacterium]|nr:IS66 family transposase [Eubacteriales bacterium]